MENVTRRGLVVGSALGVAGGALLTAASPLWAEETQGSSPSIQDPVWSWSTGAPHIDDSQISQTEECEVLVIGAGTAGCAATLAAAAEGADTLCIDRQESYEGHANNGAFVNPRFFLETGAPAIDPTELVEQFINYTYGHCNLPVIKTFIDNSGEILDWLIEELKDQDITWTPTCIKGGELFEEGSYVQNQVGYTATGTNSAGVTGWAIVVSAQYKRSQELGARYIHNVLAEQLIQDESGRVIGALAKKEDGTYLKALASKGVIVATGGYQYNEEMNRAFCPEMVYVAEQMGRTVVYTNPANNGEGHKMLMWAGGVMDKGAHAGMLEATGGIGGTTPVLCVNKNGERFTNETISCWSMRLAMIDQPGLRGYQVFDNNWRDIMPYCMAGHNSYCTKTEEELQAIHNQMVGALGDPEGVNIVTKITKPVKRTWCANTLEEVAEFAGIDPEGLRTTVDHYNELCAAGEDTDFGKHPNFMRPIVEPPFFISEITYGDVAQVMSGIGTNAHCQVLDAEGNVIPGVWAAGNTQGGRFNGVYQTPMNGISVGMACVYGVYTGRMAANM